MAYLDGIYISGIRSYGIEEEDAQSVKLFSPVSVFLGENGCGKTTIIESIKHAITGDFPFSGKAGGQTFVADPTLYLQQSVQGCIKLRFVDIYGRPASLCKILKLEKANEKFKCTALSSALKYVDQHGVTHELDGKQADYNKMVASLIGVQDAVFNYVLFCHQEDSLWPVSEDGAVKKIFDKLFDSSSLDRALDQIQNDIKVRNVQINSMKKELVLLADIMNTAKRKKRLLLEKEASLKMLTEESIQKNEALVPLKAQYADLIAMHEAIHTLQKVVASKESELANKKKYEERLRELIKSVFKGSAKALDSEINEFSARAAKKTEELRGVETKIIELKDQVSTNRKEQSELKYKCATIQEQVKNLELKVEERNECIQKSLTHCNFKSTGDTSADCNLLNDKHMQDVATCEQKEKQYAQKESELQKKIEAALTAKLKVKSEEEMKHKELRSLQETKRDVEMQLENVSTSDEEFRTIENKIRRCQGDIDDLSAAYSEEKHQKNVEANKKKIRDSHEKLERLDEDMKIHMKNSYIEKEIDACSFEIRSKEKEIRNVRNKYQRQFEVIFGKSIPNKNLKVEIDQFQQKHSKSLKELKTKAVSIESTVAELKTKVSVQKNALSSIEQENNKGLSAIQKFCKINEYKQKCIDVAKQNKLRQKKKGQLSAFNIMYKQFVKEFSEKKCCPLCETDFNSKIAAMKNLIDGMTQKIADIPNQLETLTMQLDAGETLQESLQQMDPVYEKVVLCEKDIPIKRKQLQEDTKDMEKALDELKQIKTAIDMHEKMYDTCVQTIGSAAIIDKLSDDLNAAEKKVEELMKTKTQHATPASTKSTAECETVIDETREDIKKLTDEIERMNKKYVSIQKRIHESRTQKNELLEARLKLQGLVQGKPALLQKLKECEDQIEQLSGEIEEFEEQLMLTASDLAEAEDEHNKTKNQNQNSLKQLKRELQASETSNREIRKLADTIQIIEKKQLPKELNRIEAKIKDIDNAIQQMLSECDQLAEKRDHLKDDIRDQDANKQSLENNKKLRVLLQEQIDLSAEIALQKENIEGKNIVSMERDRTRLIREITDTEKQLANIGGQIKTLKENIDDIKAELKRYDIDPELSYAKKKYLVEIKKTLVYDYQLLSNGLSNAIYRHHLEQLSSINKRLRDLWKTVYMGNDIEEIQIESGETVMTKARRRNFTYRLVQRKGRGTMPLRGKCSAGQKVLACLLVRIALSEHFNSRCAIFALDEPTTNLDRMNILSLSKAIAKLITSSKEVRNFQFIIITHDDEFLDALRQADAVREYYCVTRNNNGNSRITMKRSL